jgi:hypothetical protein
MDHSDEPAGRGKSGVDQNHSVLNLTVMNALHRKMPSLPGKGTKETFG